MLGLFRQVADVQTAEMLKLPVPALDGDRPRIIHAPCSRELKRFVASLVKRVEKMKTDHPAWVDNMLKVTGDGRKAALDLEARPLAVFWILCFALKVRGLSTAVEAN